MKKSDDVLDFDIRYTEADDATWLKKTLQDPDILPWFPMDLPKEIDDCVKRWISFYRYKCSLTALVENKPIGIATLHLHPYKKISHQCQFAIIV